MRERIASAMSKHLHKYYNKITILYRNTVDSTHTDTDTAGAQNGDSEGRREIPRKKERGVGGKDRRMDGMCEMDWYVLA